MKIDVSYNVIDGHVRALFEAAGIPYAEKDESLKRMLCRALLTGGADERPTTEEKLKRYELLEKISAATDVLELSAEDITSLKKLAGMVYSTVAVGRISKMLEDGILPLAEKAT